MLSVLCTEIRLRLKLFGQWPEKQMEYDPIKDRLGKLFGDKGAGRRLFYRLLDLLLLRAWHIHKDLKAWMKQHPNGAEVLDAGSGFGQYSYWLSRQNKQYQILAVDVKEDYLADCKKFFESEGIENVKFHVADLVTWQKPEAFDLIISVDVMEHILEDVKVFKNFHASLKPGGMVLINTPSDQGGSDVQGEGQQSFIGEHVRDGYNITEIQDKLRSAGFSKIKARYSYGAPGKISWKLSMKYPMLMMGKGAAMLPVVLAYYAVAYPVSYVLNWADISRSHKTGTGLVVKAWK